MSIDTRFSPKLVIYDICTGETRTVKLQKKAYQNNPLCTGDVISYHTEQKNGWRKAEDGSWQEDPTKQDTWLTYYVHTK